MRTQADLFLDNPPVNAHTAASDALWVGLPVLTCTGHSFIGRVAASLLHAVGLPELATNSLEEYEAIAVALATDRAACRRSAANRTISALFDTDRLRRHIEAAHTTMRDICQRGEPPRSFTAGSTPNAG